MSKTEEEDSNTETTLDEQEERFGPRRPYSDFEKTMGHIMPELALTDFPECLSDELDDALPAHNELTWVCHDQHHEGCTGELSGGSENWCHCPCHFAERNGPHWGKVDG